MYKNVRINRDVFQFILIHCLVNSLYKNEHWLSSIHCILCNFCHAKRQVTWIIKAILNQIKLENTNYKFKSLKMLDPKVLNKLNMLKRKLTTHSSSVLNIELKFKFIVYAWNFRKSLIFFFLMENNSLRCTCNCQMTFENIFLIYKKRLSCAKLFTMIYIIAEPFYKIRFLSDLRAGIFIQVQRLWKMLKKIKKYLLQTMFDIPHIYKWCLIYRT